MIDITECSCLRFTESVFDIMCRQPISYALCGYVLRTKTSDDDVILTVHKCVDSVSDLNDSDLIPLIFVSEKEYNGSIVQLSSPYVEVHYAAAVHSVIASFIHEKHKDEIRKIIVIGSDIGYYAVAKEQGIEETELNKRFLQSFGLKTTAYLSDMTIGVVGVSGTGSPVSEQLYRLGIGKLVLVDSDTVEEKNLGRIYNSSVNDAESNQKKVDVIAEAYKKYGLPTKVDTYAMTTHHPEVIRALAHCDVIFGCTDTHSGRRILDMLCNYYLIPVIDIGVKLETDGNGGVSAICYSINYLIPGKSTLLSRGIIDSATMEAEDLKYQNPEEYQKQRKERYIKGIDEERPAVISINTAAASAAVNELIARIDPYRNNPNSEFAQIMCNFKEPKFLITTEEFEFPIDEYLSYFCGRGDCKTLLNLPVLSEDE